MKQEKREIWFPAKRYGWGWGFPVTWQGWLVLTGYVAAVLIATLRLDPEADLVTWALVVVPLTVLLVLICWLRGETPKWRRGDE
jgi:hypothetical protein